MGTVRKELFDDSQSSYSTQSESESSYSTQSESGPMHYHCTRLISESIDVIVALFLRVYERKKLKMLARKWSDFSCDSHVCQRTKGPVRKKLKIDASSNFSVFYLPWQF